MKRLFKLFVVIGVLGAGIALAMRYLNSRRASEPALFEPWTPPPPMAEETLAPEEFVSVVDEPVSSEVIEEIAAPDLPETESASVAEPEHAHHDAALEFVPDHGATESTEEVEDGSSMVVELVEPETIPSTFDGEHLTPDEEFQLVEAESGSETTEEVEHGAEMTVEVVEPGLTPAEPAANELEAQPTEAALEVERGAELTEEVLGPDAVPPTELAAPEAEPPAIAPADVLTAERDEGIPVPAEEVAPAGEHDATESAAADDFLTRAFLGLAATPDTASAPPAETAAEPAEGLETPPQPGTPSAAEEPAPPPTHSVGPSAPVDAIPESSSAEWVPAEEKAFEPLSTGVANAPDLALADTLEEAIGGLTPGAITPRPARNAESFLDEGNVYFNVGQYALAIERYTRAIELDDTLTAAHYNRANARTRAGEFDGALTDYDRALQLAPNDADALNNRGMLHLYRQNYAAALRDFNAALAEDPADTTVMVNRGLAHLHGGDPIRAVEDFREATSLDPGDAAAHYGAAQASAALGGRDDALRSIERALAIDPGYAREAAADPRLAILQGDETFMRLLRESGSRTS